jgi:hypothetical protein
MNLESYLKLIEKSLQFQSIDDLIKLLPIQTIHLPMQIIEETRGKVGDFTFLIREHVKF